MTAATAATACTGGAERAACAERTSGREGTTKKVLP